MLLTVYLLFIGLHVSEGCTLENSAQRLQHKQLLDITAHTGGSVLLPCSCTDLQTKPEEFSWKKDNRNTQTWEEISSESGQYRNRVQLVNDHSPGNLSLLISHLTEEDGGDYECAVKRSQITIRLTVKGCPLQNSALQTVTAHTGGSVLLPCSCTDLQTKPEEFSWKKGNRNTQSWVEISRESGQYGNRVQLVNGHSPGNLSLLISHLTEEDGGDYKCAVKDSHILIRLTVKEAPPKPAPSTTPKPAPSTTPKPAPSTAPKPAPSAAPKPTSSTGPKPAPSTAPKPAPSAAPKPTSSTAPKPIPSTAPRPAPSTTPKPAPSPAPKPAPSAAPKPTSSTAPKPTPTTAVVSVHTSTSINPAGNVMYWFILIPVVLLLLGIGGVIYWRCRGRTGGQRKTQDEVMYSTVVHSRKHGTSPAVTVIGDKSEYATIRVD